MAYLKRKAGADLAAAADPKKARPQGQSSLMSFFGAPRGGAASAGGGSGAGAARSFSSSPSSPAAFASSQAEPKFDKAKWVAKLTKEQQQLLKLEIDTLGESWLAVLKDELTTPSFLDLKRFLAREHGAGKKIFPPPQDVYSW